MLLTEQEAREKWCPLAMQPSMMESTKPTNNPNVGQIVKYAVAANRGYAMGQAYDGCRCIASQCMAWRWAGEREIASKGHMGDMTTEHVGYCGAFGRPS